MSKEAQLEAKSGRRQPTQRHHASESAPGYPRSGLGRRRAATARGPSSPLVITPGGSVRPRPLREASPTAASTSSAGVAGDAHGLGNARLLAALGLSPAFVAMQTGHSSTQGMPGFASDLSIAASAAPYAPSADSPAAASCYPTGAVIREPSALSIGLAAGDHTPHDQASCRAANANNRAHSGGGNLSSPQWGWYESISPQLGPPGTRAIASAITAPRHQSQAPQPALSPAPAADPAAATVKSPPRPADGLDMYVSGMGGLPLP